MDKITKLFAIIFFLLNIFSIETSYGQNNTTNNNFGTEVPAPPSFPGQQFSQDGFTPPKTKKEERTIRKARRIVISDQEYSILARGEKNKDTLTFIEKIRYPFIKRRYKKFKELQDKYQKIKSDQYTQDTMSVSNINEEDTALVLSIKEKDIMQKYAEDSASLDKKELKIYKKTQKKIVRHNKKMERKRKRQEKYRQKHTIQEVTEEDRALMYKYAQMPDSLTTEEKKRVKEIQKIDKQNHKLANKRTKHKIDSTLAAGGYAPTDQKKFSLKGMFKRKQKRQRPSSYVKKMRRINRRYKLTTKEQQAYNKRKSGAFLMPGEKILANRAAAKIYTQKQKQKKLLRQEYIKSQPKHTRKMLKKGERQQKKKQKKRLPRRKKHFFKDLFKKRK